MVINLIRAHGYTERESFKLYNALLGFQVAINSNFFRDEILNHDPFENELGFTNSQLYDLFMSGAEINTQPDGVVDLDLHLVNKYSSNAVGYALGWRIFTFKNMFESLSTAFLSGHYAHEYCHTQGLWDPMDLERVEYNFPYEVGRIVEKIILTNNDYQNSSLNIEYVQ